MLDVPNVPGFFYTLPLYTYLFIFFLKIYGTFGTLEQTLEALGFA
jgi:hypothetical protein